jgi:hypothetical protein
MQTAAGMLASRPNQAAQANHADKPCGIPYESEFNATGMTCPCPLHLAIAGRANTDEQQCLVCLGCGTREPKEFAVVDRAKTGRAAAGTLSQWSEAVLATYLKSLGFDLFETAPIFRTAGTEPGPKGGRRWLPRPYNKDKLGDDFRIVRASLFGEAEKRQLADMRRSGAVEADAGGTTDADLSNKMANTISASARLRKTYTPVNVVSVRRVDEARKRGREALREQRPGKRVMGPAGKVS